MNRSKTERIGETCRKRRYLLLLMILALFMSVSAFSPEESHADIRIWHSVNMKPGDTYDVSKAKWNTTVFIKKPGDYTLKGNSEQVRVLVQSGGVNLYLADGLNINCGSRAYAATRTAAISIGDFDGAVKLISKSNAKIYLEGFICPAIRKEGVKTALVFDTEDHDAPGTIHAAATNAPYMAYYHDIPAIGGIEHSVGNITFQGGTVEASLAPRIVDIEYRSAIIGGTYGKDLSNITISGGVVNAIGRYSGAAIGGGKGGDLSGCVITGGEVYAYTHNGSAIGGGEGGGAEKIFISGGYVHAETAGSGVAIGGAEGKCKTISISGGTVVTKRKGARPGIGANGSKTIISGGNVKAKIEGSVQNPDGKDLHHMELGFDGLSTKGGFPISFMICKPKEYSYGFNDVVTHEGKLHLWLPNDNEEMVDKAVIRIAQDTSNMYFGSIPFNNDQGTLELGREMELISDDITQTGSGLACGVPHEKQLRIVVKPDTDHAVVTGYRSTRGGSDVADAKGNLIPNIDGFTDGDGNWIGKPGTLYFTTRPYKYKVRFDGNRPRGASTELTGKKDEVTCEYGSECGPFINTPQEDGFFLPGYVFDSWNTKADGTGTKFTDGDKVKNLSDKDDGVVTLYAQWRPMTYDINYVAGLAQVDELTYRQQGITFDEPVTLEGYSDEKFGWQSRPNPDYAFHGWNGSDGKFYDDGATIFNCCTVKEDGTLEGKTLTAEWVEKEKIIVAVTKDEIPQSGLAKYLFLIDKNGEPVNDLFVEDTDSKQYVYDPMTNDRRLTPGEYTLAFDTRIDQQEPLDPELADYEASLVKINYDNGENSISTVFDYYTVSIEADTVYPNAIESVEINELSGLIQPSPDNTIIAPDRGKLNVETVVKSGYHFDGYSVVGVDPGWSGGPETADQEIEVRGKATIIAHARPNDYTVKFDKNGSAVTGTMEDQHLVYDRQENLASNQYTRTGGTFTGWNTAPDGSGDLYQDKVAVKNLSDSENGEITLYAQWDMEKYSIDYDLDDGSIPEGKENPVTYTAADTFTLNNPIKEDYDFVGWMGDDLDRPQQTVTIHEGTTGKKEYHAQWALKYFNVSFEDNGGPGVETQLVYIHEKATTPEDPVWEDHAFEGWYEDEALQNSFDFDSEITKDTVIYAKWRFVKRDNPLTIKAKTAKVKYSKLKKRNQTLAVGKVIKFTKKGQGKMSYKLVSAKKGKKSFKKKIKINAKTGKVTVKKGLKKGTYKVKVKVKAAGNATYKPSAVKTVTFMVVVK